MLRAKSRNTASFIRRRSIGAICSTASLRWCASGSATSKCISITTTSSASLFIQKVTEYCRRLTDDHGLLRRQDGRTVFGFIHGNWALDNSRPDGKGCGLNGEIALLRDLGCYADFTMPSVPSPTQGRVVNQVYWCTNNPDNRPRSFDHGIEATVGGGKQGDLLMFTGPLGLRFGERLLPRLETGEIAGYDMPTPARVRQMVRSGADHRRRSVPEAPYPRRAGTKSGAAAQRGPQQSISLACGRSRPKSPSRSTGRPPGKCIRPPTR